MSVMLIIVHRLQGAVDELFFADFFSAFAI